MPSVHLHLTVSVTLTHCQHSNATKNNPQTVYDVRAVISSKFKPIPREMRVRVTENIVCKCVYSLVKHFFRWNQSV